MAKADIHISDTQYNQLVTVLTAYRNKLEQIEPLLAMIVSQEGGKAKIKRYIKNNPDEARLLAVTGQLMNFLDRFRKKIRWDED